MTGFSFIFLPLFSHSLCGWPSPASGTLERAVEIKAGRHQ
jgi:hypothetical protein